MKLSLLIMNDQVGRRGAEHEIVLNIIKPTLANKNCLPKGGASKLSVALSNEQF